MKDFLARVAGWFTDSKRAAVQALIASSIALLVTLGHVSTAESVALNELAASLLLTVQGIIGLSLLRKSEWYTWLNTTGRRLLYGAATAIGATGIAFQVWGDETATQFASVATVIASILTAFVQMLNMYTLHPAATVVPLEPEEYEALTIAAAVADESARLAVAAEPVEADPSTYGKEKVPGLAVGGVVSASSVGLIGDGPETVIPLEHFDHGEWRAPLAGNGD